MLLFRYYYYARCKTLLPHALYIYSCSLGAQAAICFSARGPDTTISALLLYHLISICLRLPLITAQFSFMLHVER